MSELSEQFGAGTENVCVRVRVCELPVPFFYAGFACGPSLLIWTGIIERQSSLCD